MNSPKILFLLLVTFGLTACASIGEEPDEMCAQLDTFERSEFMSGETSRSVTLFWLGMLTDLDDGFGQACRRRKDDPTTNALCSYLLENTSREFVSRTPARILECHGYEFPRSGGGWGEWQANIKLYSEGRRLLYLEIDLKGGLERDRAVRLTVFGEGHGTYDDDFKPLIQNTEPAKQKETR